jgi:hypothetical protein
MMKRCTIPSAKQYSYYGGRGIKIFEKWLNFECFLADMGNRPEGKTIDRIDNNGNYEPGNCRWATRREQSRNKTNNRILSLNGREMCVMDWAEEIGITESALRCRIDRYGWSVDRALTTPNRYRR